MVHRYNQYPYKDLISKLKLWYDNTVIVALRGKSENDLVSICLDSIFDLFSYVFLRDGYRIYAYVEVLYGAPCVHAIAAIPEGKNAVATVEAPYPDAEDEDDDDDDFGRIVLPESAIDPNYVVLHDGTMDGYLEAVFACTAIHRVDSNTPFDFTEILFDKPEIPRYQKKEWEIYFEPKIWSPCFSESKSTIHLIHYKFRPVNDGWELEGDGRLILGTYSFDEFDDEMLGVFVRLQECLEVKRQYYLTDEYNCNLPTLGFGDVSGKPCLIEASHIQIGYAPEEEVVW